MCLGGGRGLPGGPWGGARGFLGGGPGPMSAPEKWPCPLGSILKIIKITRKCRSGHPGGAAELRCGDLGGLGGVFGVVLGSLRGEGKEPRTVRSN